VGFAPVIAAERAWRETHRIGGFFATDRAAPNAWRETHTTALSLNAEVEVRAATSAGGRYSPAQGTSTESSVGESRATTYSAASASERLVSKWVSRGGT